MQDIHPFHQPFAYEGTKNKHIGVLCVHGFTGSPAEVRPLGEYLAKRGFGVQGILLPGHGVLPEHLKGHTWKEWVAVAQDALAHMAQKYTRVFVAGESMGGLIALHLATTTPNLVAGVVSLATPSSINDPRARLVRFAKYFVPYHYPYKNADFTNPEVRKGIAEKMKESLDLDDPAVIKQIQTSVRIPLDAIAELMALNEWVMKQLPDMHKPVLFMQGKKDLTIAPQSMGTLCACVGSRDKQTLWLDNSGHVLPLEPDANIVFYATEQFMLQRGTSGRLAEGGD